MAEQPERQWQQSFQAGFVTDHRQESIDKGAGKIEE
jgi:hypothetical protein